MNFCPECGAERFKDAKFCQNCGHAYPGASAPNVWLGLAVVVFLSGLSYGMIKRFIEPYYDANPLVLQAPEEESHDHDHDDHDHEHDEEAVEEAAMNDPARAGAFAEGHGSGNIGEFGELEQFFRNHAIMGPKLLIFKVETPQFAIVYLDQFPMEQMPEAMRNTLDVKIKTAMEYLGEGIKVELRDARTRAVLATYEQ